MSPQSIFYYYLFDRLPFISWRFGTLKRFLQGLWRVISSPKMYRSYWMFVLSWKKRFSQSFGGRIWRRGVAAFNLIGSLKRSLELLIIVWISLLRILWGRIVLPLPTWQTKILNTTLILYTNNKTRLGKSKILINDIYKV